MNKDIATPVSRGGGKGLKCLALLHTLKQRQTFHLTSMQNQDKGI